MNTLFHAHNAICININNDVECFVIKLEKEVHFEVIECLIGDIPGAGKYVHSALDKQRLSTNASRIKYVVFAKKEDSA